MRKVRLSTCFLYFLSEVSCEPDVRHLLNVTDTIEVSPDEGIHFLTKAEDVATMMEEDKDGTGQQQQMQQRYNYN